VVYQVVLLYRCWDVPGGVRVRYLYGVNIMSKVNCHACKHHLRIPGDCHISCVNPSAEIIGDQYAIRKGWFFYPLNYDPIWILNENCPNFEEEDHEKTKTE